MPRLMNTLALALLFVTLTGCVSYSEDRAVYHSTYLSPKTVFVTDTITGEAVWTYDAPPGHYLTTEFEVGSGRWEWIRPERGYPTRLEWALYPETASKSLLRRNHFRGRPIESGTYPLDARPVRQGFSIRPPFDPATDLPSASRSIEDIERDILEEGLPEPDVSEAGAEQAADEVESAVEEDLLAP